MSNLTFVHFFKDVSFKGINPRHLVPKLHDFVRKLQKIAGESDDQEEYDEWRKNEKVFNSTFDECTDMNNFLFLKISAALKANYVVNFFKSPVQTDRELYKKIRSWRMATGC
jgi:hypothetical protein